MSGLMDPERLALVRDGYGPGMQGVLEELLGDRDDMERRLAGVARDRDSAADALRRHRDEVKRLNAALVESEAEVQRYRSRCPVTAEDVEAAGVTWPQCLAVTMRKRGAHAFLVGLLGVECGDFEINEVVLPEPANVPDAIAGCVTYLAMFSSGPACDILDEMAAQDTGAEVDQ